jgi:peptidoglycan hydrolase FlgJ
MRRPEFAAAQVQRGLLQENQRISLASGAARTGGFGALMSDVRSEVEAFIARDGAELPSMRAPLLRPGASAAPATTEAGRAAASVEEQKQFIASISQWTRTAGARLGVAPELIAAHAALESGWGRHPLRNADGTSTNNMFGVKATASWNGDTADAVTTEMLDDVTYRQVASFRSYGDMASAFQDYADILSMQPRYRAALGAGNDAAAFASGLQAGGYATDARYAQKLEQVARQVRGLGAL